MINKLLLALSVFIGLAVGQQQSITFTANSPVGVTSGSASVVGNTGNASYYYWVIAKFPRGNGSHSPVISVINAPNQLTPTNYIRVNWRSVSGAVGYDVIRSNSNNLPSSGNIAVVQNTAATSLQDQGGLLTSYVLNVIPSTSETWYLNNQDCSSPIIQMPSLYGTSGVVCIPPFLKTSQLGSLFQVTNNLSEGNPLAIRSNLGLTTTATLPPSNWFQVSNNLVEGNPLAIRLNLGLTNTATTPLTSLFQVSNNLSEGTPATMRGNLGLTSTATTALGNLFQVSNNLSEGSPATIRTNIGLTSTATTPLSSLFQVTNNLSEGNPVNMRFSLGLTSTAITPLTSLFQTGNNLSEGNPVTMRSNLGLTSTATTPLVNLLQYGTAFTNAYNNGILFVNNTGNLIEDGNFRYTQTNTTFYVNHHSGVLTPIVAPNATTLGSGATATLARGNDFSGTVILTTGATIPTNSVGALFSVTFNIPYSVSSNCVVSPASPPSVATNSWVGSGTTSFTVFSTVNLAINTTYYYAYMCGQ